MSNALVASGGIKTIGSLRNIQLKRNGRTVSELDLYEFLLKGDMTKDKNLLDGDVIFIPTIKKTVTVAGEVNRPALYEIKNEKTIAEVIALAGGFTQSASPSHSKLERIREDGYREVKDINLSVKSNGIKKIQSGDTVKVLKAVDEFKDVILVKGNVSRPGDYEWKNGLYISDLFKGNITDEFLPRTDLEHVFVKREVGFNRNIEILLVNLQEVFENPQSKEDILLKPRDEIMILGFSESRSKSLKNWVDIIKKQASKNQLPNIVKVYGSVNYPGEYPLTNNMTLEQLLSVVGGTKVTAMPNALLRHESKLGKLVTVERVNLLAALEEEFLKPLDELIVLDSKDNKSSQERIKSLNTVLKQQGTAKTPSSLVSIEGFVRFPGEYPLTTDMTALDLLEYSGGLLESAYEISGEVVRRNIHSDTRELDVDEQPISLDVSSLASLKLQPNDSIVVKQKPDWSEKRTVQISGQVKFPGTYVLKDEETLADIVKRAGGLTERAFPEGTLLQRKAIAEKEGIELEAMRNKLKALLTENEVNRSGIKSNDELMASDALASEKVNKIIEDSEVIEALGRVSLVNLDDDIEKAYSNVTLRDLDEIVIPEEPRTVSVIGEVHASQTFSFEQGVSAREYLTMAGGPNQFADMDRAYIVKASGRVVPFNQDSFFYASSGHALDQGDVIVVPLDPTKIRPLEVWKEVMTIASQLAITIASFKTIGVF
ncbi:polysaccharide biosynthesis/export protein [uncultured Thiomicrorhabdus sp.]